MHHDNRINRWVSSRARLFTSILALFFALGLASPVTAQDRDPETAEKVLDLIREGNQQYDDENYQAAYDNYTEAYELYPDPAILVRLGKTCEKLGKKREAVKYYSRYIKKNPKDQTARKLEKRMPELRKGLKPLIEVTSEPDGASVYLGDVSEDTKVGTTPVDVEPEPGSVTVIITKEGYAKVERELDVVEGSTTELPVELEEADEEPIADADETDEDDAAFVEAPDDDGPETTPRETADTDTTNLGVWAWGTTGVGVALLGTGAIFAIQSQSLENDVNTYDKRAPGASQSELEDLKEQSNSTYSTSVGLFVAGGVVTATGVGILVYHLLSADKGQQSAVRLNGGVMPEGGWVGFSGRF
jgi:tetratricopeptide (TPR) repeat protein